MRRFLLLTAGLLAWPALAQAGNIAACEVVIMEYIEDDQGGGLDVASFRPATDFLLGVYDSDTPLSLEVEDRPIRALMCERNDLIPDEDDYAILATGVPFAISQDFDTNESDSLTVYFNEGAFRYKYVSAFPMSEEMQTTLKATLADFSERDHGLDAQTEDEAEVDAEVEGDAEAEPETDIETDAKSAEREASVETSEKTDLKSELNEPDIMPTEDLSLEPDSPEPDTLETEAADLGETALASESESGKEP